AWAAGAAWGTGAAWAAGAAVPSPASSPAATATAHASLPQDLVISVPPTSPPGRSLIIVRPPVFVNSRAAAGIRRTGSRRARAVPKRRRRPSGDRAAGGRGRYPKRRRRPAGDRAAGGRAPHRS